MSDHKSCDEVRFRLEQDNDTVKRSNTYLLQKNAELNSKFHQALSAGENAARRADEVIEKLQAALTQFRRMSEQLLQRLPETERSKFILENANILDTSKLL